MFNKLNLLKDKGYYPDIILDIGAYHGNWTKDMMNIYSDKVYYLFEAIPYTELDIFDYTKNIKKFIVLLSDKIEEVDWYEMKNTGDSLFREKTHWFKNCNVVKRTTIDLNTFMKNNGLCLEENNIADCRSAIMRKSVFIKIDVQGAEIPILKGATDILKNTDFILLEIPLFGEYNEGVPNFLQHIQYMDSIGFIPYDIVDNHYFNGFNMQIDILFINKSHEFNRTVNQLLL